MAKLRKVAYLTRELGAGPEGSLQGTSTVFDGLVAALQGWGLMELVHVEVPGTRWNELDETPPEVLDLAASDWLSALDWRALYDEVWVNDAGFLPVLSMMRVPHLFLGHLFLGQMAEWDRGADLLARFVGFATRCVAPTPETWAEYAAVASTMMMPYPVREERFDPHVPWDDREWDVAWVGRDDISKDFGLLYEHLPSLVAAGLRVAVVASYLGDIAVPLRARFPGVYVLENGSRAECEAILRSTRCVVSTSRYECYATVLIEGAMCGAQVVYPDRLVLGHLWDRGWRYRTHAAPGRPGSLLSVVKDALAVGRDREEAQRESARWSFGTRGKAGNLWRDYARGLL